MPYIVYINGKRKVLNRKHSCRKVPIVNPPAYKTHTTLGTYMAVIAVFLIFLAILAVLASLVMK